jgi:chromosome segregation ATPase
VTKAASIKEDLMVQMIRGLLHKKVLLWFDLGIRDGEYAKAELVETSKFIMDFSEKHGYFPTRIEYTHPVKSHNALPGLYERARASGSGESDVVTILGSFYEAFDAMQSLILNNFRLSTVRPTQKPKKKVAKVKSLRQEIEDLVHKLEHSENELFSAKSLLRNPERREWLIINRENESMRKELGNLHKTMQRVNLERMNLEAELEMKKKNFTILQAKLNDFNDVYMPRVDEIQELQQHILTELQQIRQDAELLPVMFRNEANMKAVILEEKFEAERKMREALTDMEEYKTKAKKYFEERSRKEQVALQAIGARNAVTSQLKEALEKRQDLERQVAVLSQLNQAGETEFKAYKEEFDTLQRQVFNQNTRINELEEQKKLLLDQLKQLGGTSKAHLSTRARA